MYFYSLRYRKSLLAKRSALFGITVLEFYHLQRVKFLGLIYRTSNDNSVLLELEQIMFGAHFLHG